MESHVPLRRKQAGLDETRRKHIGRVILALASVCAMAGGVAAVAQARGGSSAPRTGYRIASELAVGQRLVISPRPFAIVDMPELTAADLSWSTELIEASPGGEFRRLAVSLPTNFLPHQVVPTADGAILMVGSQDLRPGEPRRDGPLVEDVAFPLLVIDDEESVSVERDLRIAGESVKLIGSRPSEAILQRGIPDGAPRLVAHNLATGAESDLGLASEWAVAGDVDGEVIALAARDCGIQLSFASDQRKILALEGCSRVVDVELSVDSKSLAVAYEGLPAEEGPSVPLRLALFDAATSARVSDDVLGSSIPYGDPEIVCGARCPSKAPVDFAALAWLDDGRVAIVVIEHPESGDPRGVSFPESLHIEVRPA